MKRENRLLCLILLLSLLFAPSCHSKDSHSMPLNSNSSPSPLATHSSSDSDTPSKPDSTAPAAPTHLRFVNTTTPVKTLTIVSITTPSYAQADLSWIYSGEEAAGIIIERSTDRTNWRQVGHSSQHETQYSEYGLEPNTTYYFRIAAVNSLGTSEKVEFSPVTTPLNAGVDYYVAVNGNDGNHCLSPSQACPTIHAAVRKANAPGDRVLVRKGTYYETAGPKIFEDFSFGVGFAASGTKKNPITVQAAPGDEGRVIIDQQHDYGGIWVGHNDYIHIKNFKIHRVKRAGIMTDGTEMHYVSDDSSQVAVGNVFLGNDIDEVSSQVAGTNPGAIRVDGAVDTVIRNNRLTGIATRGNYRDLNTAGIKAYGFKNLTIENNYFANSGKGIHYKSHYMDSEKNPISNSTICNNVFNGHTVGVAVQNGRPGIGPPAGYQTVTHNIFYNYDDIGVFFQTTDNILQSKIGTIAHNTFDAKQSTTSRAMTIIGYQDVVVEGNIFYNGGKAAIVLGRITSHGHTTSLIASEYNVFTKNPVAIADLWDPDTMGTYNLDAWRAVDSSRHTSLNLSDPPDSESIMDDRAKNLFINATNADYRLTRNSSATAIIEDNSDAGAYRFRGEVIGPYSSN